MAEHTRQTLADRGHFGFTDADFTRPHPMDKVMALYNRGDGEEGEEAGEGEDRQPPTARRASTAATPGRPAKGGARAKAAGKAKGGEADTGALANRTANLGTVPKGEGDKAPTEKHATGKLPDEFPHLDRLAAAGVDTFAKLRAVEDVRKFPGIGDAAAADIAEALKAADKKANEPATPAAEE